uniref:Uncharacterized protein n=1 Tax=Siphoviridae sp. ct9lR64 TaxID=2826178 RepID=A0A8S5QY23_9CAUD|nr:MAG TPA: hypothetical protein [Siphoviridae sp. ct9lR64]
MIIKRTWTRFDNRKTWKKYCYTGYFLFGFIPVYIDRVTNRI